MTWQSVTLQAHGSWDPVALLRPDPAEMWDSPVAALLSMVDVISAAPQPLESTPGVRPGDIDASTGLLKGHAADIAVGYRIGTSGLTAGDLLVHPSCPVVLVDDRYSIFTFSARFLALRPLPETDPLWVWAALNSSPGSAMRTELRLDPAAGTAPLRASDLAIPAPPVDWPERRPQVEELHDTLSQTFVARDVGQSWWRVANLNPSGDSWMIELSLPDPDLLLRGVPLIQMASDIRRGTAAAREDDDEPGEALPRFDPPQLRGKAVETYIVPTPRSVVAEPGDVLAPTIGVSGYAIVCLARCVVGNHVARVRLLEGHDPDAVVASLNSSFGQRQRSIFAVGTAMQSISAANLGLVRIADARDEPDPVSRRPLSDQVDALVGPWT